MSDKAEMQLVEFANPGFETPYTMAFDQMGKPCLGQFGTGSEGSRTAPTFPPLGYNIVVRIPGEQVRSSWPRNAVDQMAMDRGGGVQMTKDRGGGVNVSEELAKLSNLKQQGILDDAEFKAAKAKLLGT